MGCNYYLKPGPACPTCGHEPEHLQIGKSSAGWAFALHVIPEKNINSLDDWKRVISEALERFPHDAFIYDEYHTPLDLPALLIKITERTHPSGLLRRATDDRVVGHGDGTWDLVTGEFA